MAPRVDPREAMLPTMVAPEVLTVATRRITLARLAVARLAVAHLAVLTVQVVLIQADPQVALLRHMVGEAQGVPMAVVARVRACNIADTKAIPLKFR